VDDHLDGRIREKWRGEREAGESQNPNVGARLVRARDYSPAIKGVLKARPYKAPVRCGSGFRVLRSSKSEGGIPDIIA
jgi:hypothetical protein